MVFTTNASYAFFEFDKVFFCLESRFDFFSPRIDCSILMIIIHGIQIANAKAAIMLP